MVWNFIEWLMDLFARKQTLARILKGSRKIDAMEQDIERFCRLVLWLLNDFFKKRSDCVPSTFRLANYHDVNYRHNDSNYYWQLIISGGIPAGIRLYGQGNEILFEHYAGRTNHLYASRVKEVYQKLEMLRKGTLREFPFMSIQYAPYVEASH